MKKEVVQKNPEKSASKVAINSFMIASLFIILTLIFTLGLEKFSPSVIWELVLAVPLLFVSSLAYAKVGYHKKHQLFDNFGWFASTLGNNFMLNVIGLMSAISSKLLGFVYFGVLFFTIFIYYGIKTYYQPSQIKISILKLLFILIILILGGVYPLINL